MKKFLVCLILFGLIIGGFLIFNRDKLVENKNTKIKVGEVTLTSRFCTNF
ncbi:MAG: hypothetical protein IKE75_02400 [Bacilli bacterium]|nr:hypothetical protein [Bacilli bacterium]